MCRAYRTREGRICSAMWAHIGTRVARGSGVERVPYLTVLLVYHLSVVVCFPTVLWNDRGLPVSTVSDAVVSDIFIIIIIIFLNLVLL